MAVQDYELRLTGFQFPGALPADKANFRFVIDIRYIDADGGFTTAHVVMPGLDTFWECAPDKSSAPNYVRAGKDPAFDMTAIDHWDSLILLFHATCVHSINISVFDVNRRDAWDAIKDNIGPLIGAALGKAQTALPALGPVGAAIGDRLGDAAEDVKSYALKRLAGGGDKVLFKRSSELVAPVPPQTSVPVSIAGRGSEGDYRVIVSLSVVEPAAAAV